MALAGVGYRYGAAKAVDGLDLSVAAGEVLALLGPNGAGKSTTINLLLGLLPPETGTVQIFGQRPAQAVAAGRIGAMLQENQLLPRIRVAELLDFAHGLYPDPMPVDEVLDLAHLTGLAGRMTEALSGGQQQRVRFAMAVIGRPDLLVLDEPTAALDVEARRDLWVAMRRYVARGRTLLFSTHYLAEADENADRIVVIAQGRKIVDGSPEEIKRTVPGRRLSIRWPQGGDGGPGADTAPPVAAGLDIGSGAAAGADAAPDAAAGPLTGLPGVVSVDLVADRAVLASTDSDATVLALAQRGLVRDLEVVGANLEDAFLAITGDARVRSLP
ncbi:sulfate ABC transporter ATP-binding protein [Plantactinospora sp. KBS50]|nr:sulfate ABC transporter ATP-binding protein [Plantactinospora sp. KBS50]